MNQLRIAALTSPSYRGKATLRALRRRSIPLEAVVLDRGKLSMQDKLRRSKSTWRRSGSGETVRRICRRIRRGLTRSPIDTEGFAKFASRVFVVSDANNVESIQYLRNLAPDLIVLGSSRILKPPLIEIPRIGILNPHPALLPEYRGRDVVAWAIDQGGPLGVTVHFVDVGVDTGPIAARRHFEVRRGDTLHTLTRRADDVVADLLAEVVERILVTGRVQTEKQSRQKGANYTDMPPARLAQLEMKLAAGCISGDIVQERAPHDALQ